MQAYMQVLSGKQAGTRYQLRQGSYRLGRHPECEIHIDLGAVSREHARITPEDGRCWIEDLGSRNGTYVNGKKIQGKIALSHNDRVKICEVLFVFRDSDVDDLPLPPEVAADEDEGSGSTILSALEVHSSAEMMVRVKPEAKLRAILEISQTIGKTLDLDALYPKILDSLFSIFPQADRALILLADADEELIPKAVKHRRESEDTVRYSRTIVKTAMKEKKVILSADAASDSRFSMSESIADFSIRSIMCVPLLSQDNRSLGVIQIDTQSQHHKFSEDDLQILASVATQAATAIENAQMHSAILSQERVQREMGFAKDIQKGFLPKSLPKIDGYEFWAYYVPAGQVGGDYYDFVSMPNGKTAVILGDVSGKGVPAALVMALASSAVRVALLTHPDDPVRAMEEINNSIEENTPDDRFITMTICVVDTNAHQMTVVNAGHMSPIIRRTNGMLSEPAGEEVTGLPLGVMGDYPYDSVDVQIGPGEQVVLFSDGISEAMNEKMQEYSMDRIRRMVQALDQFPSKLGRSLLKDVTKHVAGFRQHDDICLVVFGRSKNGT